MNMKHFNSLISNILQVIVQLNLIMPLQKGENLKISEGRKFIRRHPPFAPVSFSASNSIRKIKTETNQNSENLSDSIINGSKVMVQCDMGLKQKKNSSSFDISQSFERNHSIGKRYFDLLTAKTPIQINKTNKKISSDFFKQRMSVQLPCIGSVGLQSFQINQIDSIKKSAQIKKKALKKVQEIYENQQCYIDEKFTKIQRIKYRLKLLDKINSDQYKLKQKFHKIDIEDEVLT